MKYNELIKILKASGCYIYREAKGSHEMWKSKNGNLFVVPNHCTKEIATGTVLNILKQAGIKK